MNILVVISYCMVLDIWLTIDTSCKNFLRYHFDDSIGLWKATQIVSIYFIVWICTMSCLGFLPIACMFCAVGWSGTEQQNENLLFATSTTGEHRVQVRDATFAAPPDSARVEQKFNRTNVV